MPKNPVTDQTDTDTDTQSEHADPTAAFMAAMSEAIRAGSISAINSVKPKKVSYEEFLESSASNPKRNNLSRRYYHNTFLLNDVFMSLSDEELRLLEQLRPGRFINDLVTVVERPGPRTDAPRVIEILYKASTMDDRLRMANQVKSFEHLLRRCIEEAEGRSKESGK